MIGKNPILLTASLSMAAVLVMTMVAAPVLADAAPAYTNVTGGSVTLKVANHNERLNFNVTTAGAIPKQPDQFIMDNKVVGYAWLGNSIGADVPFVAATIHVGILDTIQKPQGWHVHSGTLTSNAACTTNTGLAVATLTDANAGVNVQGSSLTASVGQDKVVVNDSNYSGHVAAFTLVPTDSDSGQILCVQAFSIT